MYKMPPPNATFNAATKYDELQKSKALESLEENNSNAGQPTRTSTRNNVTAETSQESQVARGPNEAERQPSNTTAERASDVQIAHQTVVADATALEAENNVLKKEIEKKDIQIKEKDEKIAELTAKLEAKAAEPGSSPGAGEAPVSQPESNEPEPKTDDEAKARGKAGVESVVKELIALNEQDATIKAEDKDGHEKKKQELQEKKSLFLKLAEKGMDFLKDNPDLLKKVTIAPAPAAPGPSPGASTPNPLVAEFFDKFKKADLQTFSSGKYTVTRITGGFSIVKNA